MEESPVVLNKPLAMPRKQPKVGEIVSVVEHLTSIYKYSGLIHITVKKMYKNYL